ncbi:molybdate ABC transporter ATP-binding protein ModF [Reinekea marina]|uniref:Molybdate ABC transporter ATP-binding protein ModF n=1 Tax=Reinekea marina TaxID=1310421 RepID=A0ABV7WUS5_9GAMM|nr:molybdate ABC transporter ATP-binding protein ModF [Reinekea marina]MDN3647474.1 molybdate ABC transporter ATP-binding protein ModF [Reinekea marina]
MLLSDLTVKIGAQSLLSVKNWEIQPSESWLVMGTNGSGKTTLGKVLAGEQSLASGEIVGLPKKVKFLSLESQQELYERELYRDDTDFLDQIDNGTLVKDLLVEQRQWSDTHDRTVASLHLEPLLNKGYRVLSSGEGRRVMLAMALLEAPDLLILDEPFEGLDLDSRKELHTLINNLINDGHWLMLLVNQFEDAVLGFDKLAFLDKGRLLYQGPRSNEASESQWQHLASLSRGPIELPETLTNNQAWPKDKPLIQLNNGFVQYDETYQFKDLEWSLMPGQHSQIHGPNGCGKSTLLGLITGDHPQCYRNDLAVLGFQRGQGESIWQVKKNIGYVSGALHRDYRVSGNAVTAIISGLTDSIGVYQATGESEHKIAMQWLALIGLADKANRPFKQLSMGEQRLVLIARALIKQPTLLILDEPTQGLDDFNRHYVMQVVNALIESNDSTLLLVSHRQDETLDCIASRLVFSESPQPNTLFEINVLSSSYREA